MEVYTPRYSGMSGPGIGAILVAGGWTRDASGVVHLTTSTDQVVVGALADVLAGIKLIVSESAGEAGTVALGDLAASLAFAARITGEAQNRWQVISDGTMSLGAGGGVAPSWSLAFAAPDRTHLGSGDFLDAIGVGALEHRNAGADANADASMTRGAAGGEIRLGAGGATAIDWTLSWIAADRADIGIGDQLSSSGAGGLTYRAAQADANPVVAIGQGASQIRMGVNSADVLSVTLQVALANTLELATGDSFRTISGTITSHVTDAAAALPTDVFIAEHEVAAGAIGIGAGMLFRASNAAGAVVDAARVDGQLRVVTAGIEEGEIDFWTRLAGGALTSRWRIRGSGHLVMLGNYDIFPQVDTQGEIGTSGNRLGSGSSLQWNVFAASADANPTARLSTTALSLGLNTADALSWLLSVAVATNRADLGSGDFLSATAAGRLEHRTLAADAQPDVSMGGAGLIAYGAGGGVATDVTAGRTGTDEWGLGVGDQLSTLGGRRVNITEITDAASPYALLVTDYHLVVSSAVAAIVNLPTLAAGNRRTVYRVSNRAASVGAVTVTATGGNTVGGAPTAVLIAGAGADFTAPLTGTDWMIN